MKKVKYKGKGEHSVAALELIIEQQAEELHLLKSDGPGLPPTSDEDGELSNLPDIVSRLPSVKRVEVIDRKGRSYVNWQVSNEVMIDFQDDNKTLKVYVKDWI